jgi:hypothetical protein
VGKGSALMRPPKACIMPPTSAARHVGGGPVDFGGMILDVALRGPEDGLRSIKPDGANACRSSELTSPSSP